MSEVVRNLRACNALLLPNSYARGGGLHVTQVGSALVEQERRGGMPRGCAEMTGTRARSHASLIRALNAWLLKGSAVPAGKD